MMTALTAPTPAPSQEAVARGQIDAAIADEQAGRFGEAIEKLSSALASKSLCDADKARALFDRALAHDGDGNLAAALSDYTSALKVDPALAPAYNNRGNVFRRLGAFDSAKRDYNAALQCPGAARKYAYYGLGLVAQSEGDRDGARAFFQKALAAKPDFAPAVQGLAALSNAAGAPPRALQPYSKNKSGLRGRAEEVPPRDASVPSAAEPSGESSKAVLVQLGAYQSQPLARDAWDKIAESSGNALQGLAPLTQPVDLPGKGRLWRLRAAASDKPAAQAICSALTSRKLACMVVRS